MNMKLCTNIRAALNEELQYLKTNFNPVERGLLEKLGRLERAEKIPLPLSFGRPVLQRVEHVVLQQFLIRHANFDGLSGRAVLSVPGLHQRHVEGSTRESGAQIERTGSPQ